MSEKKIHDDKYMNRFLYEKKCMNIIPTKLMIDITYQFIMSIPCDVYNLATKSPHIDQIQRHVIGGGTVDQSCLVLVDRRLWGRGTRDRGGHCAAITTTKVITTTTTKAFIHLQFKIKKITDTSKDI